MKVEPSLSGLRKLSKDELIQFRKNLGNQPSGATGFTIYLACEEILKEKEVPETGVYIITTCGEKYHYNTSQPIKQIYIEGDLMWDREQGFVI